MAWRGLQPRRALALALVSLATSGLGCRDRGKSEQQSQRALAALPYLAATPVAKADLGKRGVTIFDPSRSAPGLNIYCSEKNDWFELRDMRGTARHRVELPGWCKLVKAHGSGFVVLHGHPTLTDVETLSHVAWEGTIRWTSQEPLHHDFDVVGDEVHALGLARASIEHEGRSLPLLDNEIVVLDLATGKTLRRRSLRHALLPHVGDDRLDRLAAATKTGATTVDDDLFHVNTIEVLRTDTLIGGAGDILIAARHLDLIGVVDRDEERLRWQPALDLDGPHHPQLLDSGNVLVFDNGRDRQWSRILELDPRSERVVWSYEDRGEPAFFSETRGSVQPLPNGNLLIAESDRGRWFELTRDKDIVWEYWTEDALDESPTHDRQYMRDTTYRTRRLFSDAVAHPAYQRIWKAAAAAAP